jgi:uncharacterized protein YcfJ
MSNLRITELDFDTIKGNLKDFLKNYTDTDGSPYFTDFDFEGSGMSILLDVLAYNTHYNAYLANMVVNEMFLDSAVKKASAISIAKHLGYTPLSPRGARAKITFTVANPTNNPASLTLDKFTPFTTTIDGASHTFVNLDPVTINPVNGVYTFTNVEVVEGAPLQYVFSVYTPGPSEKYVIQNLNVDTSTLRVSVQNSLSDTTTTAYNLADDSLSIIDTSKVYFLEQNPLEQFQIYFGDGVIGKKLARNNLVIATYLVTNGTLGNVSGNIIQEFACSNTIGGGTPDKVIVATVNSSGGYAAETIDEIKFKAPLFTSSQNRAVSANDYKAIIEKNFPLIESIATWGGEQNTPPMYGKVIISLKPYDGYEITNDIKNQIQNVLLANKQVLTITPEFITPDYLYINLTVNVKYSTRTTALSTNDIKISVTNTILNYFSLNLQKFNYNFVFSQLMGNIDNVNTSIIGNLITVNLQKRITPIIGKNNNYIDDNTIKFKNGITPGTLESTRFVVTNSSNALIEAIIVDVPNSTVPNLKGTGTLKLIDADTTTVLNANYGSINYGTGDVTITNLIFNGYISTSYDVRLTALIQDSYLDINVDKNEILLLDDSTLDSAVNRKQGLTINVTAINE